MERITMDDKKISVWNPVFPKQLFEDCSMGILCVKCGRRVDVESRSDAVVCECGEAYFLSTVVYQKMYTADAGVPLSDEERAELDRGPVTIEDDVIVDDEGNPVEELPGDVDEGVAGTG